MPLGKEMCDEGPAYQKNPDEIRHHECQLNGAACQQVDKLCISFLIALKKQKFFFLTFSSCVRHLGKWMMRMSNFRPALVIFIAQAKAFAVKIEVSKRSKKTSGGPNV